MRHLRLEKKAIRGLAISESFYRDSRESVLAGVVMRRDLIVDGFVFGTVTVSGTDATKAVLEMYQKLNRSDISYIMLSGLVISMYNIVDIGAVNRSTGLPVIAVTYGDSEGLDGAIARHFDEAGYQERLAQYRSLGPRMKISDDPAYVRCAGCTADEAGHLIRSLTADGARPEPLRVAHALARAALGFRG